MVNPIKVHIKNTNKTFSVDSYNTALSHGQIVLAQKIEHSPKNQVLMKSAKGSVKQE